jgi:hypothetical protein
VTLEIYILTDQFLSFLPLFLSLVKDRGDWDP